MPAIIENACKVNSGESKIFPEITQRIKSIFWFAYIEVSWRKMQTDLTLCFSVTASNLFLLLSIYFFWKTVLAYSIHSGRMLTLRSGKLSYISFTFILEGITSKKIFETKSDSLRNH
jgi:hypothetical protein